MGMQYGRQQGGRRRSLCAGRLVVPSCIFGWVWRCKGEHAEPDIPAGSCLNSPAAASLRGKSTFLADMAPGWCFCRHRQDQACESLPPCPHGNSCGTLQSRAPRSSGSGPQPRSLAQEPLSGGRGGLSPISIFPQESETLSSGENGNVIRSACVEQIENQF